MESMKNLLFLFLIVVANTLNAVVYNLTEQTGLVVPEFRNQSNTAYFGWNEYEFYPFPVPPTSSRILDNPIPSDGTSSISSNVNFYQNDRYNSNFVMIGSSSGNIYTGFGAIGKNANATLSFPKATSLTNGFTTLILQGKTVSSNTYAPIEMLTANYPRFTINGTTPYFVIGQNLSDQAQWWAQFNLPYISNDYNIGVQFLGGNGTYPISLAELYVDVFWSQNSYANVTAVIPEPNTFILTIFGLLIIFFIIYKLNEKTKYQKHYE
jgi:hypothetical protein